MRAPERLLTPQQKAWRELGDLLFPPDEPGGHRRGDDQEPITLRPAQVARVTGLSKTEVNRLIARRDLPSFKVGGSRLVAVSELKAWLAAHREES